MSWLPTFYIGGGTACETEAEYEGLWLQVKWLGCLLQIAIALRERRP